MAIAARLRRLSLRRPVVSGRPGDGTPLRNRAPGPGYWTSAAARDSCSTSSPAPCRASRSVESMSPRTRWSMPSPRSAPSCGAGTRPISPTTTTPSISWSRWGRSHNLHNYELEPSAARDRAGERGARATCWSSPTAASARRRTSSTGSSRAAPFIPRANGSGSIRKRAIPATTGSSSLSEPAALSMARPPPEIGPREHDGRGRARHRRGGALAQRLEARGYEVYATARRALGAAERTLRLDLAARVGDWPRIPRTDVAVLSAGITSIRRLRSRRLSDRARQRERDDRARRADGGAGDVRHLSVQ